MANYYVMLTDYGKSFIANAQASTQLALTHVVLGDANSQPYLPESRLTSTSLVHQTAKLPIASVKVINASTAEVTAIVPSNVGGFNLHEVGITDSSGKLVYIGNFHGGYRPTLTEGAGGDMELIFTITANNLATVIIEVSAYSAAASRGWVTEHFVTKPEFHAHLNAADPHTQYALKTLVQQMQDLINNLGEELMSTQFQLLSERLTILENQIVDVINNKSIKVGDTYTTTIAHANAAAVAAHHGYGTWERFAEGRALVGFSTKAADPADYKTIGSEFGANTHKLTVAEMPAHDHRKKDYGTEDGLGDRTGDTMHYGEAGTGVFQGMHATGKAGGDQPHNNIQPSKVVAHWLRTA